MKKIVAIVAVLLVAAVLLCSCGNKGNNENKEFTAKDIEGKWTMSESSSTGTAGDLVGLAGFMVRAKPDNSAVLIFKDGKITAEFEAQDGRKTAELGAYEVHEGKLFINGFRTEPKLEGRKLTLTELPKPTEEGVSKQEETEASMKEISEQGPVMILEKK